MSTSGGGVDLGAVFDQHVRYEFEDKDVEATMTTMVAEPYAWNVPTATGGVGGHGVRRYYSEKLVGTVPQGHEGDLDLPYCGRPSSRRRAGPHLHALRGDPYMLPGIAPTGRRVELPHVVVMRFEDGKIAHEHIYWHQASLLTQVGLLDDSTLSVVGRDQAEKLRALASAQNQTPGGTNA